MPRCARISVKESDVATDTNNKPLTRSVLKRKASEQLPTPQKRFCRSKNTSVRHETVPSRLKSKNCSDFRQKLPGTTGSKSAKEKNKDHDEIAAKLSTHSVVAVQDRDLRIEGDHGSENLVHPTMEALELDPMFENDENAPASRSELRNQRNLHGFRQPTLPIFELSASSEEIASYRALVSTDERQQLLHIDSTDYVARKPVIRLRVACCSALCPGLTGDTQVQSPRKPLGDVSSLVRTSEQEKSIGSNCVHAFADENKASSSSFSSGRVTRSSRRIAAAVRNGEVIQTASSRSKQQQVRANNGLENIFVHMDTSRVPDELPCREHEFEVICDFIANCSGKIAVSRTIYVSGVPGTGKTACVMQAIKFMKSMKKPPGPFKVITVNAMELIDPKFIFVEIHKQLFDQKIISPQCARRKLNNLLQFADRKREPIILIIDELDLLCTKQQEFIYDIYNWCVSDECRINVIAISNTLDLPERLFAKRVSSRMGANRLCFQPYDHNEIVRILLNRLEGLDVVQKEAVELASRKVAAVSGDLRKALDILRRSAQIAIDEGQNKLLMKNVQTAIAEASDTVTNQLIYSLSFHALLLLRSAYAERLSSGLDEFRFSDIVKHYRLISVMNNGQPLPTSSVYRLIMQLCSCRLLVAAPGSESWNRRLRLGLSAHDLQFALKQLDQNYEIVNLILANIVQRFGSRVREALTTASEGISNVFADYDQITTTVESMSRFIKDVNQKGIAGLSTEYRRIGSSDTCCGTCKAFTQNMSKNRYSDVICIDETRVPLKFGSNSQGDYIHANYVLIPELHNKFICTQGPLHSTIDDFWRMVFQERAETILMLCRPTEDGKAKCAVYWPEPGEKLKLNDVTVENIGEEKTDFETVIFKVTANEKSNGCGNFNTGDLIVKHHRWSNWPDRGVPSHESSMVPLKLLSYVRNTDGTCIVHCSAGIGRTGSVIAIEMGIRRFHVGKRVDLLTLVEELRRKRAQCIQTEIQYLYVGRVLVEYALVSDAELPADVRSCADDYLKEYDVRIKNGI